MAIVETIARLDELRDSEGACVTVGDHRIALFRVGDEVFGLDNVCPHEGGPLADGLVVDYTVTCPLHAWTFDLHSGRAISGGMLTASRHDVWVEENGDVKVKIDT